MGYFLFSRRFSLFDSMGLTAVSLLLAKGWFLTAGIIWVVIVLFSLAIDDVRGSES